MNRNKKFDLGSVEALRSLRFHGVITGLWIDGFVIRIQPQGWDFPIRLSWAAASRLRDGESLASVLRYPRRRRARKWRQLEIGEVRLPRGRGKVGRPRKEGK